MSDEPQPRYRVRETDPPGIDPRPRRVTDPSLWDWEAAYGKAAVRGRGILGGMIAIGILILVSNFYLGWRVESVVKEALASSGIEHAAIVRNGEQTTCILALTPEERVLFRKDSRADAWSRWCWWLQRRTAQGGGDWEH